MASSKDSPEPLTARDAREPDLEARRERQISEIVLAAAAHEPDEREAYLRQVTVADSELLEEARRRLRQAAELPSAFLALPAAELLAAADLAAAPTVGPPNAGAPAAGTPAAGAPGVPPMAAGAERYELGECLGKGGMARVYKAFDRQLRRPVALKLLERADPATLRRFLREAQAQARVRHEYVLEVYETGKLGGQPFIAMRYVDGPTLMEIRDDTSLEQKARLMAQVAEGLHAAHREGLIHRDVKPSNILVEATPDGRLRPWVADFGIASGLDKGSSMWTASLAGTPYYLAPERLDDERPIDRRADVYSLGVTLYQLLSGELPFHHSNLGEMLRQVQEKAPPALRSRASAVPAELEAVVMKCLATDPDERYPSARAVADDLWRFLDGKPVEAHASTFTYRLARRASHGRSLPTGALAAGLLLIAGLAVFATSASLEARSAALEAEAASTEAEAVFNRLADVYQGLGRFADAEPLILRALEIRELRLGPEHPQTLRLRERLLVLHEAWQRHDAAAEASGEP